MTAGKFPNGLRAAMTRKGIGPTRLGRLVGETKQDISRWAKGERRLVPETAAKLAHHLDVPASELLLLPEGAPPTDAPPVDRLAAAIKAFDDLQDDERAELLRYAIDRGVAGRNR